MTPEEVENTWYFNFISKVLHKLYPSIKGLRAREEGAVSGKSLVFLDAIVNPWEMAEQYKDKGLVIAKFMRPEYIREDDTMSLSTMFDVVDEYGDRHSSFNFIYRGIEHDMEEVLVDLHKNDNIPEDMKFYGRPHIMNFYVTNK